ncbi:MAG TPA: hypothetical protein VK841_09925 [Polyangiaceae bacterium]|jgi:hypothetical protein|nr:hypothetical protein [Polyangiaceae bacterium]
MRSTRLFAGLAALLVLPACGDDSSPSGTQNVPDSGSVRPDAQNTTDSGAATDEAGDDDAATSLTPAAQVSFRVAHLSPDAPPFDVCLAPQGTAAFQGPFLNAFAEAMAAANGTGGSSDGSGAPADAAIPPATGLTYGQVSAYFVIDPGTYDVRLVAAGATSCDAPLGGSAGVASDASTDAGGVDATVADGAAEASADDWGEAGAPADDGSLDAAAGDGAIPVTTLPSVVVAHSFTTLLVAGELVPSGSDPALVAVALADDSILVSGGATLRAVNALATGAPQDFGFESADGGGFLPVFADVGFAQAATQASSDEGTLDSNGYLAVGPQNGVSFGARASGDAAADTASTRSLRIDLGAVTTIAAIGGDSAGKQPPQLLFCVDNQPSGGALSDCAVLP